MCCGGIACADTELLRVRHRQIEAEGEMALSMFCHCDSCRNWNGSVGQVCGLPSPPCTLHPNSAGTRKRACPMNLPLNPRRSNHNRRWDWCALHLPFELALNLYESLDRPHPKRTKEDVWPNRAPTLSASVIPHNHNPGRTELWCGLHRALHPQPAPTLYLTHPPTPNHGSTVDGAPR